MPTGYNHVLYESKKSNSDEIQILFYNALRFPKNLSKVPNPCCRILADDFLFIRQAAGGRFQGPMGYTAGVGKPGKGWYHHLHDNGIYRYQISNDSLFDAFPGMDHIYIRMAWSFLEPEEGEFDWHLIDEVIDKYVPRGYGIAFRITCKERRGYPEAVGQMVDGSITPPLTG